MKGTVVIGHGSRSKDACDIFFKVVDKLKERLGSRVEGCFMELSEPDIPTVIDGMYFDGVRDITVLPYFLFAGIHIKEDIPEILKEIKEKYSDLSISMARPIGYHDSLVNILADRIEGEKKCI